ncbi:MAG TPA: zinc ABC transporter substrate-binding protein [Sphingobacterium sp.]|nr:zinc ABC transporter substrate-binding protein [Sphingobacterium sp.]
MKRFGLFILILLLVSCKNAQQDSEKLQVVTTTTILSDLVQNIGGDKVEVQGLMGPGVDPHLYKASEGDFLKLYYSDIVFYSGLHLEGKMVDVFEKMRYRGREAISLGSYLDEKQLISSENFGGNYDPHVWFNIRFFKIFADAVTEVLIEKDAYNSDYYRKNNTIYQQQLSALEDEVRTIIEALPEEKRILVTAHDAFSYFGKEYGFQVIGLQGISTATEAGVRDVRRLRDFIIEKDIKSIFIESSVPRRTIEALQAAVRAKKHEVGIGASLFSDALGNPGTEEGTYIGMFRYNVTNIVEALK